jgi:hypothetical protein
VSLASLQTGEREGKQDLEVNDHYLSTWSRDFQSLRAEGPLLDE